MMAKEAVAKTGMDEAAVGTAVEGAAGAKATCGGAPLSARVL
jgi:hypothetical protein